MTDLNRLKKLKVNLKKLTITLCLTGIVTTANAGVCHIVPGSVTCGQGIVNSLSGNGMVTINGTTVSGSTLVNGLLNADDANFHSLDINGSTKLTQCIINDVASIKGSLTASSTTFEKTLMVYSSEIRFINSKVSNNLRLGHIDSKKQVVYLDNFSEISGNIIFEDGEGEVILKGQSKIGGKVIGGRVVSK